MYTILLGFLIVMLMWWYSRPSGMPPGPRGIPLLGVIPFMGIRPEKRFQEWSKIYNEVLTVRVARDDWVVLNGIQSIKEAFLKYGQIFSGRPRNAFLEKLSVEKCHGIIYSEGKIWENHRKFGVLTFRGFGIGKRNFEANIIEEGNRFLEVIGRKVGQPSDIHLDLMRAVSNIVRQVLCGERLEYSNKNADLLNLSSLKILSHPRKGMLFNFMVLMPFLRFFPGFRDVVRENNVYYKIASDILTEIIEQHQSTLDEQNLRDFIDAYLVEMGKENDMSSTFTTKQLLVYIRDLIGAGTETTTSTMMWCFLSFLHYPECQEKIQDEIDRVLGENGVPSMAMTDGMPYTMAFLYEIQRYCTLAPFALPHCTTKEVYIHGYRIPKNTQVMMNIWGVHNDPSLFDRPEEFRPERFLKNGIFVKSENVIPFAVGPRQCLGESLAKMELFLLLTSILQKFRVNPDSTEAPPGLDDGVFGLAYVPRKFNIVFQPR